jgi:CRP-like cAMP-binding protein
VEYLVSPTLLPGEPQSPPSPSAILPPAEQAEARDDVTAAARHLRASYLFSELTPEELGGLAANCEQVGLDAGEILIRQGDFGDDMYVVLEGRLTVTRIEDGSNGAESAAAANSASGPAGTLLGEVRSGEPVGEVALVGRVTRMATVTAVAPTTVLKLSRAALDAFIDAHPETGETLRGTMEYRLQWARTRRLRPDRTALVEALSACLGGLEPDALAFLADEVQWVTLPRGALLMRQGEPGDFMYFVCGGRLRVFARRDDGAELHIAELGPGETVGEMALISRESRSASVDAVRDAELLRLSRNGFDRLLGEHPGTMALFTRILVDRLSQHVKARAMLTQLRSTPLVTVEECLDVTRTPNLVLRNLKITQMYHRLSLELTTMLGHADANWCTFACNASKTAGYSIRREELPMAELLGLMRRSRTFGRPLNALHRAAVRSRMTARFDQVLVAVTDTISAGNLKVFAELAPIFARMIQTFHGDLEYDANKRDRFLSTLRPGSTAAGGQDTLAEALGHYYDAMFEQRPKRKTELILLGNIKVGLHEQMRLQPNIVEALNAPLSVGLGGVLFPRFVLRGVQVMPSFLAVPMQRNLSWTERLLLAWLTKSWRTLVTRSLMTLRLPYGQLRLGAKVPELPNARMYADMLQHIEHPELARLVEHFSAIPEGRGRGHASDWGDLDDRMRFIVHLFRSRQKSLELFDQPFFYEQRLEMEADRVPLGAL